MKEYRLGVCDADAHYVEALMNYMNTHIDIPYKVVMLSAVQEIHRYTQQNTLDLLLLGEAMEGFEGEIPTVILGEKDGDISNYIYKYQSAKNICNKLNQIIKSGNICKATYDNGQLVALLCVETGFNDCRYIERFINRDKKTIIVRLEEYRSVSIVSSEEELFLYYLLSRNGDILKVLEDIWRMKPKDEFVTISGPLSYLDIRELRTEDMNWFRDIIRENIDYQFIFIFEGGVLNDISVLGIFDKVYVPYFDKGRSEERVNSFKRLIDYTEGDEAGKRFRFVKLEDIDSGYKGYQSEGAYQAERY